MADLQLNTLAGLAEFFETKIASMTENSAKNYRKALSALSAFGDAVPGGSLGEFVLFMVVRGLSFKSALHYLDLISSLYGMAVDEQLAEPTDEFRSVKAEAKRLMAYESVEETGFERLASVARGAGSSRSSLLPYCGAVVFALLNGAMLLSEIARLKKADLANFDEESRAFARKYTNSTRRFVFDFNQSKQTPRQLQAQIEENVMRLFRVYGVSLLGSVEDTLRGYWAYGALRCGASGAEVLSALGDYPKALPLLRLLPLPEGGAANKHYGELKAAVGNLYMSNPLGWYAMHLRPHVQFKRLEEKIASLPAALRPHLFYPYEEIAKRVGKKLVTGRRPLIPGVVFFRSRVTDIQPLFRQIGDRAWCYTSGGVYAQISSGSMLQFQTAIGQFTPDFEVAPVGTFEVGPGDEVVIIGGPMQDRRALVDDIKQTRAGVIYRLRIFGDERDIEYRLSDSRLIQPCK